MLTVSSTNTEYQFMTKSQLYEIIMRNCHSHKFLMIDSRGNLFKAKIVIAERYYSLAIYPKKYWIQRACFFKIFKTKMLSQIYNLYNLINCLTYLCNNGIYSGKEFVQPDVDVDEFYE